MNFRPLYALVYLAILWGLPEVCSAQLILRGMVVDSSSMQALPNVNIIIRTTGPGTTSDIRGSFELRARAEDTIVFSRVGYYTKTLPAKEVNQVVVIFLKEERRMLEFIEIEEKAPSWLPEPPPESAWKNSTGSGKVVDVPGFQGIQTFGPGYVFKGVFSGFLKTKEQKKLVKVREENHRARNYVSLVNDPDVKDRLMKDYGVTEEEYYQLLARFNEKNKDIIYQLEGHEVIALLVLFFSENTGKK